MKKYTAYIMALFAGALFVLSGCKDDDVVDGGEYNSERLFMPMFRMEENTNDNSDPYACAIASKAIHSTSNRINDVQLYWYGVKGASGYRIRCQVLIGIKTVYWIPSWGRKYLSFYMKTCSIA